MVGGHSLGFWRITRKRRLGRENVKKTSYRPRLRFIVIREKPISTLPCVAHENIIFCIAHLDDGIRFG